MMTETKQNRTIEENGRRMSLQHELMRKCIDEGLIRDTSGDKMGIPEKLKEIEKIKLIFKFVSDIIDNPQEEHEAIRQAYESGDNEAASSMLLTLMKEQGILDQ